MASDFYSYFLIWKQQEDRNVKDVNEVIGLFHGTHEQADALIEKLNQADPTVQAGVFRKKLYGYWRSEPPIITEENWKEFVPE